MCVVSGLNHRDKVVHHKRKPDGSTAVNRRLMSAVAARIKSAPNPSPATTNFLKISLQRYFYLENSVPRRSPKDEGGLKNIVQQPAKGERKCTGERSE